MDNENLISGLIGALIGVSISGIYSRITNALKLNRIRNVLLDYSAFIGLDKSSRYLKDMEFIKGYIKASTEEDILKHQNANYSLDSMPMFTSEIFNSFGQDELRRVAYNTNDYIRIIDISYSTDFLKEYLPLQLYEKYNFKVRKHMEEDNIEDEMKHFAECGYLKAEAESAINEIEMKCNRAITTHSQFHTLIKNLSGWNWWWTIKYIIKQ